MNWIKNAGLKIYKEKTKQEQMDVVEIDELKKKELKTRVWTAGGMQNFIPKFSSLPCT